MDQVVKNISDETVEVVKDVVRTAKKQIVGSKGQGTGNSQMRDTSSGMQDQKADTGKGKSPVTGKPIPSKKYSRN